MYKLICAIIPRALFILASLLSIGMVKLIEGELYWLLTILLLPLLAEMIITLKIRKGQDYEWFSPPIFLFLISIIPSIWILELHHHQASFNDFQCKTLDSWENLRKAITLNETLGNLTFQSDVKNLNQVSSTVCSNDWILALHQILLLLLIVGKWLLPLGITREELSQILLIFVGTAADILEFSSETLSDVRENSRQLVYIVLAIWTWSMLQFPLHVSVVNAKPDNEGEQEAGEVSLLSKYSKDMWSIVETLFIQDGPFLVVRLTIMIYFKVYHQMLVFFTVKNFLVIILNLYRLVGIYQEWRSRAGRGSAVPFV
ncbi:transmembrane protein 26-like [Cebidichthys violaceus]|uniref:transmembrane protein 26-like n=1 Tax=Cebidichthys violaceus TaxID=271503 RepID=UPI0035CADA00